MIPIPWRTLAVGACLGVLMGFLAWALWWTTGSFKDQTFGMQGNVTTLHMAKVAKTESASSRRLARLLERERVSVVVEPPGEGAPGLLALDPAEVLDWLPSIHLGMGGRSPRVWLFAETYSAASWNRDQRSPLLPRHAEVLGVIPAPEGVVSTDLQYVSGLPESRPTAGTYVISTTDPEQVRRIEKVLEDYGLKSLDVSTQSLAEYLKRQPLLISIATMICLGLVCAVASWVMSWRSHSAATALRARCGATIENLSFGLWRHEVGPLAAGIAGGSFAAMGAATAAGESTSTPGLWVVVGVVVVGGVLGCVLLLSLTSWATVRARYDTDVAA